MQLACSLLVSGPLLFAALTAVTSQVPDRDALTMSSSEWPVGDFRRCQEQARRNNMSLIPLEVYPGLGWDNLRNLEAGQVVAYNFSKCKLTNDGRLLIPDTVFTFPIKFSEVQTIAEIIDRWHNTSSLTSSTVNVESGLNFHGASISGKFSSEHEQMKSKQVGDKAVTVRVQLRYNRYESKLQPDPPLNPKFKSRLLSIAAHVELNQTDHAGYEAELIVRDFGTHVMTSLTAGAALVKDDYLKREFVESHAREKTAIEASASASFYGIFSLGGGYSHNANSKMDSMYKRSLTHSYIKSIGGPLLLGQGMTINQWAEAVDSNLVPMDKAGDPLYFLITAQTLPELPASTVAEVEKLIRHAVEIYYEMNIIPGCTQLGSQKFSVSANFDDGSCTSRPTNNTFGGMYQTCYVSGKYLSENPCTGLRLVNPKTGSESCPRHYTKVKLHRGSKRGKAESRKRCRSCGFLWLSKCCRTDQYVATAIYETFWCAATGPVPPESGYRFGGVYTSVSANLMTDDKSCPSTFYARRMFTDMYVCISDDFELSTAHSVPFGGFFSCDMGNPLANARSQNVGGRHKPPSGNSLQSFMKRNSGPQSWPSRCPEGYSQHLATEDTGCAVHYCVVSGALSGPTLPHVKRPPFQEKPNSPLMNKNNMVMFDMETQTWMKNQKAVKFLNHIKEDLQEDPSSERLELEEESDGHGGISAAAASGISIVCTLALMVGLTTLAVLLYKRRRGLANKCRGAPSLSCLSAKEEDVTATPHHHQQQTSDFESISNSDLHLSESTRVLPQGDTVTVTVQ